MNQQVDKKLIQKYLNGECSSAELRVMDEFMKRADAQQLIDQVWEQEWESFQEQEISDTEIAGWKDRFVRQRLQEPSPVKKLSLGRRLFSLPYAAVWAGLILVTGTWYGVANFKDQQHEVNTIAMLESVNPTGQRSKITLPDSSVVYLGAASKLTYPERFAKDTREISLQGEAFFEITKNPDRPFIIHTGQVQTKVLGTSFRITAFAGEPLMVSVATGKVRIDQQRANIKTSLAVLTPGQSLTWDNAHAILGSVEPEDVREWKNGRLAFNGATLREMATVLERWYGVKVTFARPAIAKHHLTIALTADVPLKEIMDVLAVTGKFSYSIKGKQVSIN